MTIGQGRSGPPWAAPGPPHSPSPPGGRGWDAAIAAVVVGSLVSITAHAAALPLLGARPQPVAAPTATDSPPTAPGATGSRTGAPPASAAPSSPTTIPFPTAVPATPAYPASCLRADNPATGATIPRDDPFGADMSDLGTKAELQRLYAVTDEKLVPIDGLGAPRGCDTQLFALVRATAPTLVPHLDELLVFDANPRPASGEWVIDGESSAKQLGRNRFDDEHWRLSFAPNGLDRSELAWLIAHELAHLASLNHEQTIDGVGPDLCATWYTGTGCLQSTAMVFRYFEVTWPADLLAEWKAANGQPTAKERRAAYTKFYDKHRGTFVSEYAATHPLEDFAETFALWCTVRADARERTRLSSASPSDAGGKLHWFDEASSDLRPAFDAGCEMLRKFADG